MTSITVSSALPRGLSGHLQALVFCFVCPMRRHIRATERLEDAISRRGDSFPPLRFLIGSSYRTECGTAQGEIRHRAVIRNEFHCHTRTEGQTKHNVKRESQEEESVTAFIIVILS
ncbi:hypothetical protein AOLI_G00080240 [Acnodon oligacanthus]